MTHFALFWSKDCVDSSWVRQELDVATALVIQNSLPILIICLDDTPVPAILRDRYRIEAEGMSPTEIGGVIADTVERLAKRKRY